MRRDTTIDTASGQRPDSAFPARASPPRGVHCLFLDKISLAIRLESCFISPPSSQSQPQPARHQDLRAPSVDVCDHDILDNGSVQFEESQVWSSSPKRPDQIQHDMIDGDDHLFDSPHLSHISVDQSHHQSDHLESGPKVSECSSDQLTAFIDRALSDILLPHASIRSESNSRVIQPLRPSEVTHSLATLCPAIFAPRYLQVGYICFSDMNLCHTLTDYSRLSAIAFDISPPSQTAC